MRDNNVQNGQEMVRLVKISWPYRQAVDAELFELVFDFPDDWSTGDLPT
jgi:hypothetical protein